MMQLLFPKWFAAKEAQQTKRIDSDKEYLNSLREYHDLQYKLELRRYKDCSLDGLAQALGMLHLTDSNHTENITLVPDGIKMTYKYYNSESQGNAFTAMLNGINYSEKIYGKIDTPEVRFFIGDDVAILPALKIAIAEFKRQHNEIEVGQ
jgi:hypothetical protein